MKITIHTFANSVFDGLFENTLLIVMTKMIFLPVEYVITSPFNQVHGWVWFLYTCLKLRQMGWGSSQCNITFNITICSDMKCIDILPLMTLLVTCYLFQLSLFLLLTMALFYVLIYLIWFSTFFIIMFCMSLEEFMATWLVCNVAFDLSVSRHGLEVN